MRLLRLTLHLAALLLWSTVALAQASEEIDYAEWQNTAARVERVLDAGRATNAVLERLRGEVSVWREQFLSRQEDGSLRIATLQLQLEALGAAPEAAPEPEPENAEAAAGQAAPDPAATVPQTDWIEDRRATLQAELDTLQTPNLRAAEAFAHADGLIRELDAERRERQTEVVFTRGSIPVNPLNWLEPISELRSTVLSIPEEILQNLDTAEKRTNHLQNLPVVVLLVALGIFLLRRGRVWTASLSRSARKIGPPVISYPLQALILLFDIALPWLGLVSLLTAAIISGVFGETGNAMLNGIRRFGLFVIVGTAFVRRLLPAATEGSPIVTLEDHQIGRARRLAFSIVYLVALGQGVELFLSDAETSGTTQIFTLFPFFVLLGYLLFRFSRLFTLPTQKAGEEEDVSISARLLDLMARLGMITGAVAPLAAAMGYAGYAAATLMPAAYTIFALGLAAFISDWLKDLYAAARRRKVEENDLGPTLIGIGTFAMLIPVLALIWGARMTDLTEVWTRIREGFSLGGVRISPTEILTFLLVFSILYGLTRLLQSALRVSILPKTKLDQGSRTAIVSGLGYIGVFLAAIVAIQSTGLDLSSLAIVAGALSVGIGFGLQTIVSNFVSGIILLIERPISEGDWIDVNGNMGYVRDISVRSTRIETFDRTDVIVPNSDLISGTVTNWTRGKLVGRVIVPVGVAYGTDTARVERILREIAEANPMVLLSPPPSILFMGFGADALDFEIRAILRDVNFSLSVKSDMNHEIARRFRDENIEIPFAQRDLWLRNPETLRSAPATEAASHHPPEARIPQPQPDEIELDGQSDSDGR